MPPPHPIPRRSILILYSHNLPKCTCVLGYTNAGHRDAVAPHVCGNFFALVAPRILKWLLDCCGKFRVWHFGFTDVLGCCFEAEVGHACRCLYNKLSYRNVHCVVSFDSLIKKLCLCISNKIGKYLVRGYPRFSSCVTETDICVCVCVFCCCWIITVEPFLCKQHEKLKRYIGIEYFSTISYKSIDIK